MLTKIALAAAVLAGQPVDARLHGGAVAPAAHGNGTAMLDCTSGRSRCNWAHVLLATLGYPVSQNNLISLVGWMQAEGSPCA